MNRTLILIIIIVVGFQSCRKDETWPTKTVAGTYEGEFHAVAGCYACIPYLDSTYAGNFLVEAFDKDSIKLIRSYDKYNWTFPFSADGNYSRSACCTMGESFTFTSSDSLNYFYNMGGSGGYYRITFNSIKR